MSEPEQGSAPMYRGGFLRGRTAEVQQIETLRYLDSPDNRGWRIPRRVGLFDQWVPTARALLAVGSLIGNRQ